MRKWPARVDNWCHADGLGSLYSWIFARDPAAVHPQLVKWNRADDQWLRRISLVSLIHYSGKNAVFVPPERALPLVTSCLKDERESVQRAVGWVLREMDTAYPVEVRSYIEEHARAMSSVALRRAIERRSPAVKAGLLAMSKSSSRRPRRSPR